MEDYQIVAESLVTTGPGINVTGTGTLKIGASASISLASGASLSLASGVNTVLASGANLSLASGATLSLASGAVEIAANGASLSLASGAVEAGAAGATLSLASGATLNANGQFGMGAPGTASVSVATASGTTVPVAQGVVRVSNTAASTSGSCTLAAGAFDGQLCAIVNEAAAGFVVTGNMKANQTVAASSGALFVWVSTDTQWWRCN